MRVGVFLQILPIRSVLSFFSFPFPGLTRVAQSPEPRRERVGMQATHLPGGSAIISVSMKWVHGPSTNAAPVAARSLARSFVVKADTESSIASFLQSELILISSPSSPATTITTLTLSWLCFSFSSLGPLVLLPNWIATAAALAASHHPTFLTFARAGDPQSSLV